MSASPADSPPPHAAPHDGHLAVRIVRAFIDSKLTPLVVVAAILLGVGAVRMLPREEEPQIVVPMIDLFVSMPGASPREIERRVSAPMEKLLWEIPGVEYVYSTSSPGLSMTIVRFYVGTPEVDAIVLVNQKMAANFDRIPPGVIGPLIKPRRIDDVPMLALTLHGAGYDHFTLRRLAAELEEELKPLPEVSETTLIGGQPRVVRVEPDAARMAAYGIDPLRLLDMLRAADRESMAGSHSAGNREILVETGGFLADADAVDGVVVGVAAGKPVYLGDVARVLDGPGEPTQYVLFGRGAGAHGEGGDAAGGAATLAELGVEPAVTLALAKRKGANAIDVADAVLARVEALRGRLLPDDVAVAVTRNYGETAKEKSDELLFHMAIAVVGVTILIALMLGWREAGVVGVAIPVTLALTLATFYLLGFTLNRITLFALIFAIGILVDDPIVDVENIVRHFHLPGSRRQSPLETTVAAVNEVRSPLILATLTVIAAIVPMAFVRGLMGPYMRPIPIGASAAMIFSMLTAFVVTPWAAYRILSRRQHAAASDDESGDDEPAAPGAHPHGEKEDVTTRAYRRIMAPLLSHRWWRIAFLAVITLLLLAAVALLFLKAVKVKMLPFDNKSEFQIIVDTDEGSTLEHTTRVATDIAMAIRGEPEVTDFQIYAGTAAPYNFNGLVRHYFLRRGANVADVQVNLVEKGERSAQSHDIAVRIRPRVEEIAARHGARVKIAEVPPGPPVLQTLVAEIYGPDYATQIDSAARVREIFEATEGVVDVDWYVESPQPLLRLTIEHDKAALAGISADHITNTVTMLREGAPAGLLHDAREAEDVVIEVRWPLPLRAAVSELLGVQLRGSDGSPMVPLGELVRVEESTLEPSVYRKNLKPVVYVTADVGGAEESPVYAILKLNEAIEELGMEIYSTYQPEDVEKPVMKWDGEWYITYEVFRDLGLAFAVVLILIYVLIVGWFASFKIPLVIMVAIPFSLVGILPAHWAMGAFFTATSMIGFIAGAGIVVRNSIILVDFIELRRSQGMALADAVVDAGAVRFRPMLLTALAVVVSASVILFDPIFQGLAISLMAGEIASLLLSRMAVPVIYYMAAGREPGSGNRELAAGNRELGTGNREPGTETT
jgi:multidrug efflux pump subunit AcrB